VTSEELHEEYPDLDVHGREDAIVNKHGAVFIIGMGWPMKDGSAPEEVRSPGYDDWHLNGDIMVKVCTLLLITGWFVPKYAVPTNFQPFPLRSTLLRDTVTRLAAWASASTGTPS